MSPLWHVYVRGLEPLLELLVGSRILSLIRSGIPLVPRNEGRRVPSGWSHFKEPMFESVDRDVFIASQKLTWERKKGKKKGSAA